MEPCSRPEAARQIEKNMPGLWEGDWRSFIRRKDLGLVGFLALLAGLTSFLYFVHFRNFYNNDSPTYITPAINLIAGKGFTDANGNPEVMRTPGYPVSLLPFLWAKLDLKYLIIFQHLLRVLIILATAVFILRTTGSSLQAYVAGCFLGIDLPFLEAANLVMPEILFSVVLMAVLWLLWREALPPEKHWIHSLVPGALAGASVLIRPVSLFFFAPAAAYLLLAPRCFRWRAALSFFVAFAFCPMLWTARNYLEGGYLGVSSITAKNLLLYRAAGVLALTDPGDFRTNFDKRQNMLESQACEQLTELYGKPCSQLTAAQQSEYYSRKGRRILMEHPFVSVKLALRAAVVTMLDGGPNSLEGITGIKVKTGIRILLIYTVPAFCFALVGLERLRRENRQLFYLTFFTILYFVAISAGAEAYSRFRVPVEPAYALLIAKGADYVFKERMGRAKTLIVSCN